MDSRWAAGRVRDGQIGRSYLVHPEFRQVFRPRCGHLFGIRPFRLSGESARRLLTQLRLTFRGERAAAGHVGPRELRCWQRRKGGSIAK
jgi:hypothetical protein